MLSINLVANRSVIYGQKRRNASDATRLVTADSFPPVAQCKDFWAHVSDKIALQAQVLRHMIASMLFISTQSSALDVDSLQAHAEVQSKSIKP
jgi:hypothetical protein